MRTSLVWGPTPSRDGSLYHDDGTVSCRGSLSQFCMSPVVPCADAADIAGVNQQLCAATEYKQEPLQYENQVAAPMPPSPMKAIGE